MKHMYYKFINICKTNFITECAADHYQLSYNDAIDLTNLINSVLAVIVHPYQLQFLIRCSRMITIGFTVNAIDIHPFSQTILLLRRVIPLAI